jgi:hypothetical protein
VQIICIINDNVKEQRTSNGLQIITQKIKDPATRTALKTGVNAGPQEELAVPAPQMTTKSYIYYNS